jgi:ABC-type dipeptide/oligopeptide/nickel transport systems, permease components
MEDKVALLDKVKEARRRRIRELWDVFRSNKPAYISMYVLLLLAIASLAGPYIAPLDPYEFDLSKARLPPSLEHPLGTDELGRDMLSRILVGARYTLGIAVLSVITGASIGTLLGLISGYRGGLWDVVIQRVNDVLLAFPTILLAIALVAFLGQGVYSLIIAIAVSSMPVYVRLVRASVLQVVTEDYVLAARMLGLSEWSTMMRHILPNVLAPVVVQLSYHMGLAILIASALGFLGLGVPPPAPEWGAMIGSGKVYIFSSPHIVVIPGFLISITILAFNMVGDGLREALDPKVRALVKRL